jgi:hypothetical protein
MDTDWSDNVFGVSFVGWHGPILVGKLYESNATCLNFERTVDCQEAVNGERNIGL